MFARILFTALVLFCFLFICMAGEYFADVSADLEQAEVLKDNRQYEQAEAIYQQIVTAFPGTNDALEARKQLVLIYIATDRQQQADTAFEQLVTDFSEHKDIAEAVWQIAMAHGLPEEYNKAFQLHQYNVEHFPDDKYAMRSQTVIIYYYIRDGNDAAADVAIDKLFSVFSDQPDLPKEIYQVTERYKKLRRYDKAIGLHQYSVEHFPNHKYAMWSQVEIVYSHVRDGNDAAADEAADKLLTVFSDRPTLPKEIYLIAMKYNEAGRKDKALELHQYNVEHSSKNDLYTMWSQSEIIKSCIHDGNDTAADAAFDNLLNGFSSQPDLPKEIYQIAIMYNEAGRKDRALQLNNYNVEHSSKDNKYTMWSQVEIIKSHIHDGNNIAADEACEKLFSVFSDQPSLPKEIYQLANRYNEAARVDKAGQLYQYILKTWPGNRYAMLAQDSLSAGIHINDEPTVTETIDKLIADFNDHPDLPLLLSKAGEKYCYQAFQDEKEGHAAEAADNFTMAMAIWQRVIEEMPTSSGAAPAYYYSAVCYRYWHEYEKAIEYFQKVVSDWPDYEYAAKALYRIGECYEGLRHTGTLSKSEVEPLIEQAYKMVIENYPDSDLAPYAALKLGQLYFNRSQWPDAAMYFELFIEKDPNGRQQVYVLYDLGRAYEEMGESNLAAEVYRTFIELANPTNPRTKTVKVRLEKLKGAQN